MAILTAGGAGGDRVSACNVCGRWVRVVAREVREVIAQVIENIAGGKTKMRQCAPLVLHTTPDGLLEVGPSGYERLVLTPAKMEKNGWKIATAATAGSGMKRRGLMSLVETAGYDLRSSSWGNSISQRENATALTSPRWVSGRTLARTIGAVSSSMRNRPSIKGWVAMVNV